jgi:hypothetical protein
VAYVRRTSYFPGSSNTATLPSVTAYNEIATPTGVGFSDHDSFPQILTENEFVYKDDFSVTKGKHNFKLDTEYRRTPDGRGFDPFKYGYVLTDYVEDPLTDSSFTAPFENAFVPTGAQRGSIAEAVASLNPSPAHCRFTIVDIEPTKLRCTFRTTGWFAPA